MDVHVLSKVLNLASHRVHQNVVQNVTKITKGALLAFPLCFFLLCFFSIPSIRNIPETRYRALYKSFKTLIFYSFCHFCILVLQLPCNDTFTFLREFSFLFAPQLMLVIPSLRKKLQVVLAL